MVCKVSISSFFMTMLCYVGAAEAASVSVQSVTQSGCANTEIFSDATVETNIVAFCDGQAENVGVWAITEEAFARASFGSIGTSVSVTADTIYETGFGQGYAFSEATAIAWDVVLSDVLTGFISIPFDIAGSIENVLTSDVTFANVSLYTSVFVSSPGNLFDPITVYSYSYFNTNEGPQIETIGSTGISNVLIPIIDGSASFVVYMNSEATCATGSAPGESCIQTANFLNSARLLGATVLDSGFNPVVGASLSSESGFDYLEGVEPHISPVPLPSPGILLLAGLLVMGALATARKPRGNDALLSLQ